MATNMIKPLHFQINPHSGVAVYRQLMDQIKYYIASGALKPGDQLPSIRDLAHSLSINPTTVIKTYSELQHSQAIEMRHGKGAFVAERSARMSSHEREAALRVLARHLVVEGTQMGASADLILRVVEEEIAEVDGFHETTGSGNQTGKFLHG
jgi:GntR family transcriptional regulator